MSAHAYACFAEWENVDMCFSAAYVCLLQDDAHSNAADNCSAQTQICPWWRYAQTYILALASNCHLISRRSICTYIDLFMYIEALMSVYAQKYYGHGHGHGLFILACVYIYIYIYIYIYMYVYMYVYIQALHDGSLHTLR